MTIKEFAFDCTFIAAIRVKATDYAAAIEMLHEHINAADANLGMWPSGDPILCEVSLCDKTEPALYEFDGNEATKESIHLAMALRRFADGGPIDSGYYSEARSHDRTTGNDRDALMRAMHGKPMLGDADRIRALADELESEKS